MQCPCPLRSGREGEGSGGHAGGRRGFRHPPVHTGAHRVPVLQALRDGAVSWRREEEGAAAAAAPALPPIPRGECDSRLRRGLPISSSSAGVLDAGAGVASAEVGGHGVRLALGWGHGLPLPLQTWVGVGGVLLHGRSGLRGAVPAGWLSRVLLGVSRWCKANPPPSPTPVFRPVLSLPVRALGGGVSAKGPGWPHT